MDYLIPGMLGFLTGALIFGAAYPSIYPPISRILNLGSTTLPAALGVNLWLSILLFVLIALTLLYYLERSGARRKDKVSETEELTHGAGAKHG
jgi:uncharacterized protein